MSARPELEQEKEKVRQRYKGTDAELLEVKPGEKHCDFYDDVKRRVGVYVRVSTDNLQQTSSYELQKNYYEEKVRQNDNWTLVDIYADEGISGTSLRHRDEFNRMIEDCMAGKLDLIITKSVSRFARNIVDCISIVRKLSALKDPVGVFFETENIYTLNDNTEMSLSFTATMAQEESHIKSSIMNASIEMRFGRGIVLTPVLLGYDHDEDGKLTINESEARTVRLIFFMYLYGYSCQDIAASLTKLGRTTKKGNTKWSAGSVLEILKNERHCGEILTRKTYTPSYLDHRSRKNRGERAQYRWKGEHEPIISKDDFIAVQHLISNAKYGNKGILPELQIITEGAFKGFTTINPRWSGFKAKDYTFLAQSVCEDISQAKKTEVTAMDGEFDYRGFEIARSQFFNNSDKLSMTLSVEGICFSSACIKKLDNTQGVELLIHPLKKMLLVRKSEIKNRNAVKWCRLSEDGRYIPVIVSGAAFLPTVYELLSWDIRYKYRVRGTRRSYDGQDILIFDLTETEMYITQFEDEKMSPLSSAGKIPVACPADWAESFGKKYYCTDINAEHSDEPEGENSKQIITFEQYHDLNVTNHEQAADKIHSLLEDMKKESHNG